MQSEIDEMRACLAVLDVMADSALMTPAFLREACGVMGRELDKLEAQAVGQVLVPVMTLAPAAAGAARDGRARLAVVEGGRP